MTYNISPTYNTYNIGGEDPDDSWSRDSYDGSVTGAEVSEYGGYNGVEVESLPVYAVVVGYSTGDTFGSNYEAVVVDAFEDEDTANLLAMEIDKLYGGYDYNRPRNYGFTFNDKEYYTPWEGYFERLQSVGVYKVDKPRYNKKY